MCYLGHFNLNFQCTNMYTSPTSTLPSSAQICVLRPLQPLPFSAQICILRPLQPYLPVHKYVYFGHFNLFLSVHKYVYFGHFNLTFQCTNMCTSATSTLPFSAHICVLQPLIFNIAGSNGKSLCTTLIELRRLGSSFTSSIGGKHQTVFVLATLLREFLPVYRYCQNYYSAVHSECLGIIVPEAWFGAG
jgi:hypothetical protein